MKSSERMCIACRNKSTKNNFIKISKTKNDEFYINEFSEGRSAYICKDDKCIEKVCKNKLLNKTFKCNVKQEVYDKLNCLINKE